MSFNVQIHYFIGIFMFLIDLSVLILHFICLCNEYFSVCNVYGDLFFLDMGPAIC